MQNSFVENINDKNKIARAVLAEYLGKLKAKGLVGTIVLNYSGESDNGYINNQTMSSDIAEATQQLEYEWDYAMSSYCDADGYQVCTSDYRKCLLTYAHWLLPPGFEINEGSRGCLTLNVETASITVDGN